jgi:hypothetical protein
MIVTTNIFGIVKNWRLNEEFEIENGFNLVVAGEGMFLPELN